MPTVTVHEPQPLGAAGAGWRCHLLRLQSAPPARHPGTAGAALPRPGLAGAHELQIGVATLTADVPAIAELQARCAEAAGKARCRLFDAKAAFLAKLPRYLELERLKKADDDAWQLERAASAAAAAASQQRSAALLAGDVAAMKAARDQEKAAREQQDELARHREAVQALLVQTRRDVERELRSAMPATFDALRAELGAAILDAEQAFVAQLLGPAFAELMAARAALDGIERREEQQRRIDGRRGQSMLEELAAVP